MTTSETLRARAAKAQERADRANDQAFGINERFEGGQPIIVNHHSTKGAQRDRTRADVATRAAILAQDEADRLNRAATREERKNAIRARLAATSITNADVAPGDIVWVADLNTGSATAYLVARVNALSVTVDMPWGTDRIPYNRIVEVVKP